MAQRWRLTSHARQRAREMGLGRYDVLLVLRDPQLDHVSVNGNRVAKRDKIALVYDPRTKEILTVLWNTQERYQRQA